ARLGLSWGAGILPASGVQDARTCLASGDWLFLPLCGLETQIGCSTAGAMRWGRQALTAKSARPPSEDAKHVTGARPQAQARRLCHTTPVKTKSAGGSRETPAGRF